MFKWLADMLVKTPVQSSCSCCEGKKQRLQKMQEAILSGDIEGEPQSTEDAVITCDTPEHEYAGKILGSAFYGGYPVEGRGRFGCGGGGFCGGGRCCNRQKKHPILSGG